MITVLPIPALQDNYIWLVCANGRALIVDPGASDPVIQAMDQHGLIPEAIFYTHHHWDHIGGIAVLVTHYDIPVYGPKREALPTITHPLGEADAIEFPALGLKFSVIDTPGHTLGQIAYYGHGSLFCGDTLFSAGCGRLREGTAEQLHASLSRLAALPEDTLVYCGHEYTQANLRFALTVEPDNAAAHRHLGDITALRRENRCTLPSTIGLERRINPFLRASVPSVRAAAEVFAGGPLGSSTAVFAALRRWKDEFRG